MKKRSITLLEIMIVIFLIAMIGGAIGYNMKGSLDKGRAFKTKQSQAQIVDILTLEEANGKTFNGNAKEILEGSGLVKNVKKLIEDGWGNEMTVTKDQATGQFSVISERLLAYNEQNGIKEEE